jgi:cyclohexanecarboxyl-CoA dehydrogenase
MVEFTEAQEDFRRSVREFVAKELAPGAAERAKLDHIPPDIIGRLAQKGLLGLMTPVHFGGMSLDSVTTGIAFEETGAVEFSLMVPMLSHVMIPFLLNYAAEDLRNEWLPILAAGTKLACFGNTEPDCGSDAGAIKTKAIRDGDYYIINGEKTSISGGMQSDVIFVTAKTNPAAGVKGITCFLVPFDQPGVSRSRFGDLGNKPSGRASVFLNDVRIPARYRIGEEGEGFVKVMSGFDFLRVLVALVGIGMAQAAIDEAVGFVKERKAFGGPISRFEGVALKLADGATLIDAARLLCYRALRLRDAGLPHSKESAMAKSFGVQSVVKVLHDMLLIHGWQGYSKKMLCEQRLRDAIGLKLGDGTNEILKLVIARHMLGRAYGPIV